MRNHRRCIKKWKSLFFLIRFLSHRLTHYILFGDGGRQVDWHEWRPSQKEVVESDNITLVGEDVADQRPPGSRWLGTSAAAAPWSAPCWGSWTSSGDSRRAFPWFDSRGAPPPPGGRWWPRRGSPGSSGGWAELSTLALSASWLLSNTFKLHTADRYL